MFINFYFSGGNVSGLASGQTHSDEHSHGHEHGHTHEVMDNPGMWTERDKPVNRGDWKQVIKAVLIYCFG